MNRNKIPAYYRKKGMPGFFIMQRVREMVAGNVREGLDGRGVTVAGLDTGDCVTWLSFANHVDINLQEGV